MIIEKCSITFLYYNFHVFGTIHVFSPPGVAAIRFRTDIIMLTLKKKIMTKLEMFALKKVIIGLDKMWTAFLQLF